MCHVAHKMVDRLSVLVCTRDCEPINGYQRFEWVRQSLDSDIRVLHLHRDIPQDPSEHPDFWNIWRNVISAVHPEVIDTVFGSEIYILQLAKVLDAAPFIVDLEREIVPVSASMIRQSPKDNWQYIPKAVRPYYQTKICILGPESTGKTTLCKMLAEHFQTSVIPEYGRTYDAVFKQGKNWTAHDFHQIAHSQVILRDEITSRSSYISFEDTDLLQTLVWAEYLLGAIPDTLHKFLETWVPSDFYLLLEPNVPWIDDGTRYDAHDTTRYWFFETLEKFLKNMNLPYKVISAKEWPARFNAAKEIVSDLAG